MSYTVFQAAVIFVVGLLFGVSAAFMSLVAMALRGARK